jgi:hypothetical protein
MTFGRAGPCVPPGRAARGALKEDQIRASSSERGTMFGMPVVIGLVIFVFAQIAWLVIRFSRGRWTR